MKKGFLLFIVMISSVLSCFSCDYSAMHLYIKDEKITVFRQLFDATERGSLAELTLLISLANTDVNEVRGESNITLLHVAALQEQKEVVEELLARGADVTARTTKLLSPIHYAARTNNIAIMNLLLEKDPSNIHIHGCFLTQPLHWAAKTGKIAMVKHLLYKGAQVNAKTSEGETPLIVAITHGHVEVIKALLEAGAETPLQNYQFKGPINVAMELLLEQDTCTDGWRPNIILPGYIWHLAPLLHWAAKNGKLVLIKELLRKRAYVNIKAPNGQTPLVAAIAGKHSAVAEILRDAEEKVALVSLEFMRGRFDEFAKKEEIVHLINTYMRRDKTLQEKMRASQINDNEDPEFFAKYHQLSCCRKIWIHADLMKNFGDKQKCLFCGNDPELFLIDTTPPHPFGQL